MEKSLMKKSRRNHAPAFKAKVALEAAREECTVTGISRKHGVHAKIGELTVERDSLSKALKR